MQIGLVDVAVAWLLRRLGALLRARGLDALATHCDARARSMEPGAADSLYADARASWDSGDHEGARALLGALLERDPEHARATNLLGAIRLATEDYAEAEALFQRALRLDPHLAAAHNNLGNIFLERGDDATADAHYCAALACDPYYVESINNRGMVLVRQGRYAEAEEYLRRAIALKPDYAGAHSNLGSALFGQDRRGEAIKCFRDALQLNPELPEAHLNLALALNDPEQLGGILAHYRRVLEHRPDSYIAHLRVGTALQVRDDWDASEFHLQAAEQLRPAVPAAPVLRGNNRALMGDPERAVEHFRRALLLGDGANAHCSYLFYRLYDPALRAEDFLASAREWAVLYAESRWPPPARHPIDDAPRRLRIGYMTKDFARHSVAYFLEPVLARHDRARYEVFCYSNNPKPDDVTARIEGQVEHWRDIAFDSDDEAYAKIVADGIDVLVELSGHTSGNRLQLLARRPAAVQVSYLGYPATTGLRAIDYRITDAITDPPGAADFTHTEKLVRLPDCFHTYLPSAQSPEVAPAPCAVRGYVTFGSFNNPAKINGDVVAAWARILNAVPNSRLLLKGLSFASRTATERFAQMFATQGVGAERLDLMAWDPEVKGHLELYGRIDIALDPFPYNGTTTTCDALWMGVPVIALAGDRHAGRVGASLLAAVGLAELVCSSLDDYVSCAAKLAADAPRLERLRSSIRERMRASALLDAAGFTRNLEAAYEGIWRRALEEQEKGKAAAEAGGPTPFCTLDLPDAVRICVPDSLEVMTRYVIEEQGDWFEREIPFVRALAGPGMHAVDIGANYGAYALALSRRVGAGGRVWAFEPAPDVAEPLRRSGLQNSFAQLEVIEAAVADRIGHAALHDRGGAELRQISLGEEAVCDAIPVSVTTLDTWAAAAGWPAIDFVKIDAEGQEPQIVRGGSNFLRHRSPLVMAEYLNGVERNDAMIDAFAELDYIAWRLAPALHLLISANGAPWGLADDPPLNLFFCKRDRAESLALADRLALEPTVSSTDLPPHWENALSALLASDYARPWTDAWRAWMPKLGQTHALGRPTGYRLALAHYALSRDASVTRALRWHHLDTALNVLRDTVGADAPLARTITHARLLYDAGFTRRAAELRAAAVRRLLEGESELGEPFVPPCPRYERFAPTGAVSDWLLAACLEQEETVDSLSAFLDPAASLRRLRDIRDLGYGDADLAKRTALIMRRFDERWLAAANTASPARWKSVS